MKTQPQHGEHSCSVTTGIHDASVGAIIRIQIKIFTMKRLYIPKNMRVELMSPTAETITCICDIYTDIFSRPTTIDGNLELCASEPNNVSVTSVSTEINTKSRTK